MTAANPGMPTTRFLGRYELMYLLGQGGMGEVHLARLTGAAGFEKLCIVKTILPQMNADPQFVDRFHHEAKVLVQLNHSNIAQVYDMGDVDQTLYMAIEYVPGVDLARVTDRTRATDSAIPIPVALLIGQQMCEALGYAHRKVGADGAPLGIVHRDVSPQNVMVSYEGEVKVIDFGLAKSSARSKHTLPSTVLGKLGYMSPEQARAESVDHRSDIYSAGIVLWELLAGRPLIQGGTVGEMVAMMANPKVPSLREIRPDVSEAVEKLVMRALQSSPSARYSRADDLSRAINEQLVRENLSVSSEDVGNYVRAMCPEEFAAERQLQSRLSMMRKKGSSPDQSKPQMDGTMVRAPASAAAAGYGATQVRTPAPGRSNAPMTAAQRAMSSVIQPQDEAVGDITQPTMAAYVPTNPRVPSRPGSQPQQQQQQMQPSGQYVVPKSKAPMVVVLLLLAAAIGGGAFAAWRQYGQAQEALIVEPPPPEKVAMPEKELAKAEPPKEDAKEPENPPPPKQDAVKPTAPLERIEVKSVVMKIIHDGDKVYVQLPPKVKLVEGDQVKLLSAPIPGGNLRDVYGVAPVVESKGSLARLLLDADTSLPTHAFAIKDEAPRRVVRVEHKEKEKEEPPAKETKEPAAKEQVAVAKDPPAKEPEKVAKADPPRDQRPAEEVKAPAKEEPAKTTPTTSTPTRTAGNYRELKGGIVLGSGVFKKVHIYNRTDFDWHGCELRLPNKMFFRYEPDDQIAAGESDGIMFTKFKDDTRPEDPQASHGWALVRCKEGAGYLQFKSN